MGIVRSPDTAPAVIITPVRILAPPLAMVVRQRQLLSGKQGCTRLEVPVWDVVTSVSVRLLAGPLSEVSLYLAIAMKC